MESIVTAVFNFTIGWLLKEGRDITAKKLREGDVVDHCFYNLIARELDGINSKLNGLAKKDLGVSISFFNEGLKIISLEVSDRVDGGRLKGGNLNATAESLTAGIEAVSLIASKQGIGPDVKERFKDARKKATEAFKDTALDATDRISAMYIRVMATLLEEIDNPTRALALCRLCLEEMYCMNEVKNNFNLEVRGGYRSRLQKEKRRKLISSVCHLSRIVFDVVQLVGGDSVFREFFIWPTISLGIKEEIDPLRDHRLKETLQKQQMEHCSVIWSFGQEGVKDKCKLQFPSGIATNSQGQFVVVDNTATKVFDKSGKFLYSIVINDSATVDIDTEKEDGKALDKSDTLLRSIMANAKLTDDTSRTVDIDTDRNDNLYLLVQVANERQKGGNEGSYKIYVFDKNGKYRHTFPLSKNSNGRKITVNSNREDMDEVLVLEGEENLHARVEVYNPTSRKFVCHFGERVLHDAQDIVGGTSGLTLVLDRCADSEKKYVQVFSAERESLQRIPVESDAVAIAFHRASEHFVISSILYDLKKLGLRRKISLYKLTTMMNNNDDHEGKPERIIELNEVETSRNESLTVTANGRIAMVLDQSYGVSQGNVTVI